MKTLGVSLALAACVLPAAAFNFTYNSTGSTEHWTFGTPDPNVPTNSFNSATHAIRYFLSSDGWSGTNTAAELNAVRNSFGQWQSIPGTVIKYEEAGFVAPGYRLNSSDNTNVVYWAKTSTQNQNDISGAVGFTSARFTVPGNVILQFDIVLNGWQDSWYTDFSQKTSSSFFIEGPLTHEIGHSLGMSHASMGGATMLFVGGPGIDTDVGLSVDEIAFARALYPGSNILSTLGNLKGTVTKNGSPVFGAAVVVEDLHGNLAGSTVTLTNGTYILNALPPGNYNVRVDPLDSTSATGALITGPDISPNFNNADPSFLPNANAPVTLTAGTTNTLNFAVTNAEPAFRITNIRVPSSNPNAFSWSSVPVSMNPGDSNFFLSVASDSLPTNNATLTVTGDGLAIGPTSFAPNLGGFGLNFMTVEISVASNATPGLRTFIVTQGTNTAVANGYLEILPTIIDYNFDGLDDTFQRQYFSPFTSSNAAPAADPDHDGMNNFAEWVAGTDPTNPSSFLKLTSVTKAANGTTITWLSGANHGYQVMSRSAAASGTWTNVGGIVITPGTNGQFLDTSATSGTKFYRVQALAP